MIIDTDCDKWKSQSNLGSSASDYISVMYWLGLHVIEHSIVAYMFFPYYFVHHIIHAAIMEFVHMVANDCTVLQLFMVSIAQ